MITAKEAQELVQKCINKQRVEAMEAKLNEAIANRAQCGMFELDFSDVKGWSDLTGAERIQLLEMAKAVGYTQEASYRTIFCWK